MTEFSAAFDAYIHKSGALQQQAAVQIAAIPGAAEQLQAKLAGEHRRAALALLSRCAKRLPQKRAIAQWPIGTLCTLLRDPDAKTRKNAAILIGALEERAYVPALIEAHQKEMQQFVRPSQILALGALGGVEATAYLRACPLPEGDDPNVLSERDALQKALSRLCPQQSRPFTGFRAPHTVWLMPVSGLLLQLLDEGKDKGLPLTQGTGKWAQLTTDDYRSLFRLRTFYEALLPLAAGVPVTPEAFAAVLQKTRAHALLNEMHGGSGAFPLRLELRGDDVDRGAFARALFAALPNAQFTNAPSSYDVELRAFVKEGRATLSLRLHSVPDPRFDYRLSTVPASIHPAAAAAVLYAHRTFMQKQHTVLDPCCGAGTLMIERAKLMGTRALTGTDISPSAWRIARGNCHAAGLHAKVYNRDARGFHSDYGVDEIICNLPFGHRVGNHESNESLYDTLLAQWPALLKPNGFVLAITNEKGLFKQLAQKHGWRVVRQTPFSSGGLSPSAFLLMR